MTEFYNTGNELEELSYTTSENMTDADTSTHTPVSEPQMPATPIVFGFDYTGVSSQVAQEAEAAANRIRDRHRASIIETGHDLCAVKEKLEHGLFGNWLSFHFDMSERTAQNYMNAAAVFGSAPRVIDVLPPTTIYKLAAKGAPEDIRQSVIEDVAKGVQVNHMEIASRIAASQKEERQRREDELAAKQEQRAWQKHEHALRAAGGTDHDIEKERKRWDAKKARKERDADQKALEAQQRETAALHREEGMKKTAARAAEILKKRLGDDYEKFRDVLVQIDYQALRTALLTT